MKMPVIVLGAGGHAKVLINCLLLNKVEIIGIVDNDAGKIGRQVLGVHVIGKDEDIVQKYSGASIWLINGVGSIKSTQLRKKLFEFFKNRGYTFGGVIHPSAIIAHDVTLGEGAQIMAGAIIQPGCYLGNNVIINTRASIDHDCAIDSNVHIAPGVVLSGDVHVGEGTHIGTGTIIKQGVRIGANCIIGAGTLVVKDISDNAFVVGSPAKIIEKPDWHS